MQMTCVELQFVFCSKFSWKISNFKIDTFAFEYHRIKASRPSFGRSDSWYGNSICMAYLTVGQMIKSVCQS